MSLMIIVFNSMNVINFGFFHHLHYMYFVFKYMHVNLYVHFQKILTIPIQENFLKNWPIMHFERIHNQTYIITF